MAKLNRREMVLGVGAAGVAALGPASVGAAIGPAEKGAAGVLREIRLAGAAEREFLARMGPAPSRPSRLPEAASPRPTRAVEARVVERKGPDGKVFARGLAFDCDPKVLNALTVGGVPVVARRFSFSADEIGWTPGAGFPVYASYCPRYEYGVGTYYPEAKWHQVVPVIGGASYFVGCQGADVCEGDSAGPVCFDVNGGQFDGHAGGYRINLWGWS